MQTRTPQAIYTGRLLSWRCKIVSGCPRRPWWRGSWNDSPHLVSNIILSGHPRRNADTWRKVPVVEGSLTKVCYPSVVIMRFPLSPYIRSMLLITSGRSSLEMTNSSDPIIYTCGSALGAGSLTFILNIRSARYDFTHVKLVGTIP